MYPSSYALFHIHSCSPSPLSTCTSVRSCVFSVATKTSDTTDTDGWDPTVLTAILTAGAIADAQQQQQQQQLLEQQQLDQGHDHQKHARRQMRKQQKLL